MILVWILPWFLFVILSLGVTFFLNIKVSNEVYLYYLSFSILPILFYPFFQKFVLHLQSRTVLVYKSSRLLDISFISLSLIAVIFLYIDRVYYQQIDLSLGIAQIRLLLYRKAQLRVEYSSIFSMLGQFLSHAYMPILITHALVYFKKDARILRTSIVFVLSYIVTLAYSFMIAGRSPILFYLVILSTCLIFSFLKNRPQKFTYRHLYPVLLLALVSILYNNIVLSSRFKASHETTKKYTVETVNYLSENVSFLDRGSSVDSNLFYAQIVTVSYFMHSTWRADKYLISKDKCYYTLKPLVHILNTIKGRVANKLNCEDDGFMVSLPIALVHDYGVVWMLFFSITFFVVCNFLYNNFLRCDFSFLNLILVYFGSVIILSPFMYTVIFVSYYLSFFWILVFCILAKITNSKKYLK